MQLTLLIDKIYAEIKKELGILNQVNKEVKTPSFNGDYNKFCDHTVLKAYTPRKIVEKFCDEAKKYKVASVCVNPIYVSYVSEQLKGTDVKTCTVIGFPLGANTKYMYRQKGYSTSIKNRIIAENQQIVRVDREDVVAIDKDIQDKILQDLPCILKSADVVAISDYAKGFLSDDLCSS